MNKILSLDPIVQALIATIFTWSITALGAALVYFFKKINKTLMDGMLGFAGGVMIAASFFSLISPAIDMSLSLGLIPWLVVFIGFFLGGVLLFIGDKVYDIYLKRNPVRSNLTPHENMKRCFMLISSITLHNIPEGMAVGVVFSGLLSGNADISLAGAYALSLGIAIQNFPEGAIISMPLRAEGNSRFKSFLYGTLSGVVEPIGAVLIISLSKIFVPILPVLLSFAAGAMIYVVVEELIPEANCGEHSNIGVIGVSIGFVLMMILDVALG